GDGDDQDDTEGGADEGGEGEPKYTQADIDKAVARTIAKERAKAERAAKRKTEKENSGGSDGKETNEELEEARNKASKAETKVACYEAGVTKDAVDDVAALARSYMQADDSLDLEDAIEKVVKKYPHFKGKPEKEEEEEDNKAWGERQRRGGSKISGVEAAFLKKNPGLKI
ncbi:hypothetical protein, partial [Blautia sp.]|uniref:hypothetical protein n=1 Tax=Blautia sp. TaxID=1955243 RepID=UPI00258D0ECB